MFLRNRSGAKNHISHSSDMPKLQHPLRRGLNKLSSVLTPCARGEPWVCQSLAEGHSSVPVNHNNALKTSGRFPDRLGSRVLKKPGGAGRCRALIGREGCRSVRSEAMVQLEHIDGQCRIVYPVVYFNRALVCKRVGEEPCRESLLSNWALLLWARWQQKSIGNLQCCEMIPLS